MLPLFQVPYFNVSLKAVVFGISVLGSIYALSTIFIQIYEGGKGKNGSTVAVSYFYFQVFSLLTWTMKTACKCKWNYILYIILKIIYIWSAAKDVKTFMIDHSSNQSCIEQSCLHIFLCSSKDLSYIHLHSSLSIAVLWTHDKISSQLAWQFTW